MTPPLPRLPVLAVAAAAVLGLLRLQRRRDRRLRRCARPGGAPAATAAAPAEIGTVLSANSTDKLGTVVVDGQGYTLYRFDKDTAKPPASNCAGELPSPPRRRPGRLATAVAQDGRRTITVEGRSNLQRGAVTRYGETRPPATVRGPLTGTWAGCANWTGSEGARIFDFEFPRLTSPFAKGPSHGTAAHG